MADKTIPALKILRGKVGINTATPSQQLHVNGEAYIFTGSTSVRTLSGIFKADTIENSAGASNLKLQTESGGNKHIEITPNGTGNVGINTNAPAKKLEVNFTGDDGVQIQNTGSSHASIWLDGGTGGVGGAYLRMTSRDGTNTMTHWINLQSNGNLVFRPAATGTAANQIIFNQNGSIGIGGTPTSGNKLFVNGNSYLDGTAYVDDALTVDGNINFDTIGSYLTFYGNANAHHSISSRNSSGNAVDDLRINTYGALFINLDSNGNDSLESHSSFQIGRHAGTGAVSASDLLLNLSGETGKLRLYKYGSGTHTGTATYKLAVDSSGNVIETAVGAGQVDGSGTTNYVAKWTDGDTIGNSSIFDNGSVGIGTNSALNSAKLDVRGNVYSQGFQLSKGGSSIGASISLTNQAGDSSGNDITVTANHSTNSVVLRAAQKVEFWTYASSQYNLRVRVEQDGDAYFYGGNWYCNYNNSSNVTNGGLYINRGGGLYAYALATARSGTGLGGVDFWDYHGVGLVFGPDSSTKVLTVKSNIGIGTTNPGYILDVRTAIQGAMQVKGAQTHGLLLGEAAYSTSALYTGLKTSYMTGVNDYMIISGTTTDGNTYISAKSGGNAHMRAGGNNSTNEIVVSASTGITYKSDVRHEFSTGNVGIGTNPAYKLEVKASVTGNWLAAIYNTATSGNSSALLVRMDEPGSTGKALGVYANGGYKFSVEADGEVQILSGAAYATHLNYQNSGTHYISMANGGATYFRGSSNNITTMTVKGDGNVGIGTASPNAKLSIKGDTEFLDENTGVRIGLLYDNGTEGILDLRDNNVTKVNLRTAGASYFTGGSVGIGTNSPDSLLMVYKSSADSIVHVRGANSGADARVRINGYNSSELYIDRNGVGRFAFRRTTGTDDLSLLKLNDNYTDNSTIMFWDYSSGNVGIASTSPAATLDVKQGTTNNNNKLMKVADDVLSVYKVIGQTNHTVTLTCGSYFQAEVVITANQTNGGTYNNLYIRGIWSNNHTSHHWDEIENIGSLTGSSFSITVGQNDVSNSGKLTITHTYSSGSFAQMVVRVTDFYGTAHSYSIT